MELSDFVAECLPRPRSKLLEIGCGDGELALGLSAQGHFVTAIDPRAPSGPIFRQISLEDFDSAPTFDAVVANRSLHHIEDLDAALGKIHSLLAPHGVVILNEFAWDRLDEPTVRWYRARVKESTPHKAALQPGSFPDMWIEEHAGLHASSVLIDRLSTFFYTDMLEWVPYIARHYLDNDALESVEAKAIDEGRISAIGFRYVGRKTP